MTPSLRSMPIVAVHQNRTFGWHIDLPNGRQRIAVDEAEVRRIVARELPGTAIRFIRTSPGIQPSGA